MSQPIIEIHHDVIPLRCGIRLAYRAWLPEDALQNPVPAILEYLPYRKNDGTICRDEITLPATAASSYACIRVDIRGSGESEGLFDDEYSEQELSDAEEVIHWLSQQAWCDGNVGMVGISWGGFNALQLAARQPPALRAIITICSTDDRFNEDIHFAGGCLLNDNLDWAAFFWSYAQARCPDPRLIGANWREMWLTRLQNMPFLADRWIQQQRKNRYWKHGSVSEDYASIKVPVYAIGGWADAYRNTIFRLLENLRSPCKGLIGPWAHKYPNIAYPEPKIDYVKESVRWWDRWLKGVDNDVMEEPPLHYYLMASVRPAADYSHRSGRWQSAPCWPSEEIQDQRFCLQPGKLSGCPADALQLASVCSPESTGRMAGKLMVGIGHEKGFPGSQQQDDDASLVFDTNPLSEALNIVGAPHLQVAVSSDQPVANMIARLCDVHPDGDSTLITYGVLNLTHRDSNETPRALIPDQLYEVELALHHIAYQVPKTHRLRLSISNAYWPLIWPSPYRDTLTFVLAKSQLKLPIKAELEQVDNSALRPFEADGLPEETELRPPRTTKEYQHDKQTGITHIKTVIDYGHYFYPSCATEIDYLIEQHNSIHPQDPCSAKSINRHEVKMQQGDTHTALESHYEMTCSENRYFIKAVWRAWEGETCIFEKEFDHSIRRHLI